MSLINQMLKDLEAREQGNKGLAELPSSVRVVEEPERRASLSWLLVAVVVLLVALAAGWLWLRPGAEPGNPNPAVGTPEMVPPIRQVQPEPTAVTAAPTAPEQPAQTTPVPSAAPIVQTSGLEEAGQLAKVAPPEAPPEQPRASDALNKPSDLPQTAPARPPEGQGKRAKRTTQGSAAAGDESLAIRGAPTPYHRRSGKDDVGARRHGSAADLESSPDGSLPDAEGRIRLARAQALDGDEVLALKTLEGLPRFNTEAGKLRAQLLLKLGRARPAEQELLDVAALDGADPEVQGLLGALYQKQARYDDAASHYGQALRSQPGQSRWWLGLAVSLEGAERYQEALEAYVRTAAMGGLSRDVQAYVAQRIDALRGQR